ncbi:MAG TPA: LacI family DNA-binding transcriptional regulator [Candidatus Egerieicola faecale]|uniref:LacI family DNA-binding transcriptional regulator n=1 Tax=Candidatus Egerieicola faecale TaxID=2840774 RepID=A0A9D1IRF1_9FIRM|nr:LacI family DNA-binding transcriptional regulator [Candidatus Egerieicola faecale]
MTIYDISKKAGVSIATVSRVLNGSGKVSEKTKEKVLAVMEESGYTPNLFARGLGLNTMHLIGILCVDSSDLFLAKAVYYLEQELYESGYGCLLCCTGYTQENKEKYMKLLLSKKVDACILVGSSLVGQTTQDSQYILDAAKEIPVMLLNAYLDGPNLYCVLADDYLATYTAARQLYQAGVKNLLYYYDSNSYSGKEKLRGFQEAMKANGVEEKEQKTLYYSGSREDIHAMTAKLAQLHQSGAAFDGVIASDDNLALSAVKFAKSLGRKIPEEFSVIGYNHSLLAQCSSPSRSPIRQRGTY